MIVISEHEGTANRPQGAAGRVDADREGGLPRALTPPPRNASSEPVAITRALADCDRLGLAAAAALHGQKESTLRMWRVRYRGLDHEGLAELQRLQRENETLRSRLEDLELRLTFLDGVSAMVA